MSRPWFVAAVIIFAAFSMGSCDDGDGDDTGGFGTKKLPELTRGEQEQLCDWEASKRGGYGQTVTCSGGVTVKSSVDQAACVQSKQEIFRCDFPVSQYQTCVSALAADPCNLQLIGSDRNCSPIFVCSLKE